MSGGDSKLRALQKKLGLQEEQLLLERNRIDEITKSRKAVADRLAEQVAALEAQLIDLRTKTRVQALHSGNGQQLAGISAFELRITQQLAGVTAKAAEANSDFAKAAERLEAAETDLLTIRVEKKRMEKLLDSRQLTERVKSDAREEALTDEMNSYRRPKRDN